MALTKDEYDYPSSDEAEYDYPSSDEGDVDVPAEMTVFFGRTLHAKEEELAEGRMGETLVIKQFTVDSSCKDDVVTVQVELPEQEVKFQVCHLRPGTVDQFNTELVFDEPVSFSLVRGKGPVHMIGNVVISTGLMDYDSDDEDLDSDESYVASEEDEEESDDENLPRIEDVTGMDEEESEDEEEEAPQLVKSSGKRGASAGKSAAKKAKAMIEDDEDEEEEEEEDEDEDEDEEDEDFDLEDDNEDVKTKVKQAVTKATPQKKQKQKAKSAATTPAKNNKAAKAVKSAANTPAAKKEGSSLSVNDMLKKVLASPNKPKKQSKFKNFCKNMFKAEPDEATLDELWKKYSANISK
ncbi:hypothetical protein PTSG_08455 [Salpingoeca rosetta]|uniref:Nucleoplasmin-like domain-containing protein n=1 Tax=Salpingoeca rosetta (strain ATCC 50818 / BSB-021) TaxID=946362 RepID=F2UJR3_SALR5|nr:uncharacterized protein PTSG_08455 [Salpingoeca rosetta]EGD77362.1 hypothetical protein PTSG_08455 [Salpingoeca rosetta]|eukprot:XP_004990706.1 hypothetical protein PTSG_08455 [Salpingoeca rosetta]